MSLSNYQDERSSSLVKIVILILCLLFTSLGLNAPDFLPEGHRVMGGLIYGGAINAADLEQVMAQIRYDLNLPVKGLYDFSAITVSGFYRLADNVSDQITISVSDVTLDLNGHTVSGGTYGIVINSGLNNVTIKNGTVRSTTLNGIQVNSGCSDITVENIVVKQAVVGIGFDTAVNCVVRNCDMNLNTTGLLLDTCANISVNQCSATANQRAGYDLLSSTTCMIVGCKALSNGDGNSNTTGEAASCFGFVSNSGYGNVFEQCIANSTQNLNATDWDAHISGFALRNGESCSKIIKCEAGNSTSHPDGNTVPYGIWLEGTLSSLTTSTTVVQQQVGSSFNFNGIGSWSADGNYIVIPLNPGTNGVGAAQLFKYDRQMSRVQLLDEVSLNAAAWCSAWSPDGNFFVVGTGDNADGRTWLYELDRVNEKMLLRDSQLWDTSVPFQAVLGFSWSYDGLYLAVCGENSGTAPRYNIKIYEFDRIGKQLIERDQASFNSATIGDDIFDIAWTQDGSYFTVTGDVRSNISAATYPFDRTTKTVIESSIITMSPDPGNTVDSYGCSWSYDDKYLAVVSALNSSANTRIYRFDGSNFTLVESTDNSAALTGGAAGLRGAKIRWSPDGRFLAVSGTGATTGDILKLYSFDRDSETLTQIDTFNNGSGLSTISISWAPDGSSLLMTNQVTANDVIARIFDGIIFPEKNILMHNTVYCNSGASGPQGVGISGSSIKNMIVQNSSFDNAFNYHFVTNAFNQLFGDGPTLLQNLEVGSDIPITQPLDLPAALLRMESLTEMLANNLL